SPFLVATHVDSWENGAQNWTAEMREAFTQRRGYDPLPFLPVMTGRVVESLEISERFLWDLRQTISDLVVENYAGHLQTLAHDHGMQFTIEAYGGPCDDMPYAGRADEPMGEFWVGGGAMNTCKEMASAGHTYGKRIIGAESFTAADQERWLDHPATIKALGDRAFCAGINRFVFHRYALQPWADRQPGMTMGPWGVHYERTQTWWDLTPAWHQYLARCQHLLRQRLFVADICYLQPEASPQGFNGHNPKGYDFDNCSAEAVLTRMSVQDGRIVLPDGMSYRLLVLPEVRVMTPALLRKIGELIEAGATVVGPRPLKSPSLTDYPACDDEVKRLADAIWGDCDGRTIREHRYGHGRVVWGETPESVLADTGLRADFTSRTRLHYIHRAGDGVDLYFVANPHAARVAVPCTFRVEGKRPELWWPESGRIERAAVYAPVKGGTSVLLTLDPSGSVFVVFREEDTGFDPVVAVAHDGEVIACCAAAETPEIVVKKALYGILDDPQRTRDVRDDVQRRVDAGETSFRVSRLAEGGDPAQNTVKTVEIEYAIDDESFSVSGRDTDTVHLSGEAPDIVIEKAVYGVLNDPQRTRDVRDKLQHLVDTGEVIFEVARMAEGDDPAFGIVKTLIADYTIGGDRVTATGTDPETLDLALPVTPAAQTAEVKCDAEDRIRVEAWEPGRYELTMASGQTRSVDVTASFSLELEGPWDLAFAPGWGAPDHITLDALTSWSDHTDSGVKYFSGTATYAKSFTLPEPIAGTRLYLDLGKVYVMARVTLNGEDLGVLWKPPFCVDVTDAARPGENTLEVAATNLWVNRLIGDEFLPEDSERHANGTLKAWPEWLDEGKPSPTGRYTFTTWRLWHKDDALQPSGLLGPVTLRACAIAPCASE
ncbi:MAG TPA: glycosyl hydrolase, partial [Candidatus Hydrogenedentes bacterium]|nr:glycosyl hydrolase [Candidatus Hydrogenedentota bacterium]